MQEFSHRTRQQAIERFKTEKFDLLVIGGGITGAATARDAVTRGLKVALVEKNDFAWGTSSRSSKLIHGGLRYLQNFELGLVFEALAERTFLLKTVPHMVRPLPFYMPVYDRDRHGRGILSAGLWLYDLLALLRAPGTHKHLSRKKLLGQIPFLNPDGLKGGFRYFDASMWDDVLAIETVRAAAADGAAVANYVEACEPIWKDERIVGFSVRDVQAGEGPGAMFEIQASRVVVCAGPWTDVVGQRLSPRWRRWLNPSKGVHLIFDLKRFPVPGAVTMSHPEDGRIAFVIPRPDFGPGVVIVGTTDGPTPLDPEQADIDQYDVEYLLDLLHRYFPALNLKASDILSAYVGVRPLMGATAPTAGSEGQTAIGRTAEALQKVSREHFIGNGPGGTIVAAGGKYTTHRRMAQEIVDVTLKAWKKAAARGAADPLPAGIGPSRTKQPLNPRATIAAVEAARAEAGAKGIRLGHELFERYGAEALEVAALARGDELKALRAGDAAREGGSGTFPTHDQRTGSAAPAVPEVSGDPDEKSAAENADGALWPEGFPLLEAQLRHAMRTSMVVHLEDFYFRRIPLFAARKDHGLPWADRLSKVWAEEMGLPDAAALAERRRLEEEVRRRSAWEEKL